MESPSQTKSPIPALWIAASRETLDQTSPFTKSIFTIHSMIGTISAAAEELSHLTPGSPIILEFEYRKSREWVEESNRLLQRIIAAAEKPIVLCIGDQVPAEVVVDWVRAGAFSYVERTADEQHMQQAFQATALQSATVQVQYHRYDKLLQLWNSITDREASVLNMLMEGFPNKKIANCLGVSQRTIEARRQKLYEKLESRSVVDVVRTIYELEGLEKIFHRIDSAYGSGSNWLPNTSKFLQGLPQLHSEVPPAHFGNRDEAKSQSPSRKRSNSDSSR